LHPIIALSVLEAVRSHDGQAQELLPDGESGGEAIKLGRTRSVAGQIERYTALVKSCGDVEAQEIAALFRLVARRPDANLLFADAGRRAARHAANLTPRILKLAHASLPAQLRNRLGRRLVRRAAARVFDIELTADCTSAGGGGRCPASLLPGGQACGVCGSGLAELLRGFTSFDGACFLTKCRARGSDHCRWSTEHEHED
jgi:hypothetical protein